MGVVTANTPPISVPSGPYTGTEGVEITFDGSGSSDPDGSIGSYAWDFGDTNTGSGMSPRHIYAQNRLYTVTLTVTDNEGATATGTTTATIGDIDPIAEFTGIPAAGPEPLTVSFSDTSTSYDGITAWKWDFNNDGIIDATTQNPDHEYSLGGIYTVTLTVNESDGDSQTVTKTNYITVSNVNLAPISDPNGPYTGTEGVEITFDGSGSYDPDGSIGSYTWDFGDTSTGTGMNPRHIYAQNRLYTVTLTVTDNEGATATGTTTATIGDIDPIAEFTGTPAAGPEPLTVSFSDTSTSYDGITAWKWDFNNDGIIDATTQNPDHEYSLGGIYTVTLTVNESDSDSQTVTKTNYITVSNVNQPPISDPNGPYTGTEGVEITFDGSGSYDPDGSIGSYAWDFGDTSTGTGMNPRHIYAQNGLYTVTLTVTDNEGATATSTTTATIEDVHPIAEFTGTPATGPEPLTVSFNDTSTTYDGITAWKWDFNNDGIIDATTQNPDHEYSLDGIYTVTLTVNESDGDSQTVTRTDYITVSNVNQAPISDPDGPYKSAKGVEVTFDGSGSSDPDGTIVSYTWDFGDTNTGTGMSPKHIYDQNGLYTVTLTVTDNSGATAQDTTQVTISTDLVAEAKGPSSGFAGISISFNGSAYGGTSPYSYRWDFDISDGINTDANGTTPTHTYKNPGIYTVILNVSDSDGKYATDALLITVKNVTTTKGSGGESSSGIGTSGETFENIICTETDRRFIGKDQEVSYNFNLDCNCVTYVNFTGLISFGKEATKVEILNQTSSLVGKDAPDIVFKNLNVWIGPMGLISETNLEHPTISFYVDKSWLKDNSITLNTIALYSYDDYTEDWEKMSTRKIGEDSNGYYYKADLPIRMNIGAFAISGINLSFPMVSSDSSISPVIPARTAQVQATPTINSAPSPITWTGIWKEKVPHYQIFFAILVITSLYIVSIKWDRISDTNVTINGKLINPLFLNIAHPIVFICLGYVLLRLILYILDVTNTGVGWLEGNQGSGFPVMILILSLSIMDTAVTLCRRRLGDDKDSLAESGISLVANIKRWKELPSRGIPLTTLGSFWNKESVRKSTAIKVPSPIPEQTLTQNSAVIHEDEQHTSLTAHSRPVTKKYIYYDKMFSKLTPEVDPDGKPDSGPVMERRPKGP